MKRNPSARREASALVIVLTITVVMVFVVVGLATAMRTERLSAHYASERTRAEMLATAGVEEVKAAIQRSTKSPRRWISMPGRLITSESTMADSDVEVVDLYSGLPENDGSQDGLYDGKNLNLAPLSGPNVNALDPHSGEMSVGWIYFRKDGTRDLNQRPDLTNKTNPIVGRVAYWTDDESTRLNLNTAWKRVDNPRGDFPASKVNLLALSESIPETDVDTVRAEAQRFPFASPDDILRVGGTLAEALSQNRFSTTYRSNSPDLNPWGDSKIVLTTKKALAGDRPFFDILRTEGADPGKLANLDGAKTQRVLESIMTALARSDWPSGTGSFIDKYGERNAQQMAIDLVEYVRSVESTEKIVEPMRVYPVSRFQFNFQSQITDPGTYLGTTRRPMLTEMGVHFQLVSAGRYRLTYKFEFLFPGGLGLDPADYAALLVGKGLECAIYTSEGVAIPRLNTTIAAANCVVIQRGDDYYAVVTASSVENVAARPASVRLRPVLNPGTVTPDFNRPLWEVAPVSNDQLQFIPYNVDDAAVSIANMTTVQVNDPRINKLATDWVQSASTLGDYNTNWKQAVSANPPQDTQGGAVSGSGLRMPAPAGSTRNPLGRVLSIGETGFITTGVGTGVPWRSIRLQPASGSDPLPDWALLDLFATPFPVEDVALHPSQGASGKINVNGTIQPFTTIDRLLPVEGLLKDTPQVASGEVETLARNIARRTYANASPSYRRSAHGLLSVGEIAEIEGISDAGEDSEDIIRQVVDLASVRSNVFRVHSTGQSLKQTTNGKLIIEAEKSIAATLERDAVGKIKVVHWKVLAL